MQYEKAIFEDFEDYIQKLYGGDKHVAFSCGERGAHYAEGFTVPDIFRQVGENEYEAIECKSITNWNGFETRLFHQILKRIVHLPDNCKQRIVIQDFGYSEESKAAEIKAIRAKLDRIYPDIPIDFVKVGETL